MSRDLDTLDIRYLKGVGERRAALFAKLGADTVGALLRIYPRGYLDLRSPAEVMDAPLQESCAIRVRVEGKAGPTRISGGRTMSRVFASDGSGEVTLTYFNNQYLPSSLKIGEEYLFYGRMQGSLLQREMINPALIRQEEQGGLYPRYPATEGLSSRAVASAVRSALSAYREDIEETLPQEYLESFRLMGRREALEAIHFPRDYKQAESAKRRLIFEELLVLQLGMYSRRSALRREGAPKLSPVDPKRFSSTLPFRLTGAQRRCIEEIFSDMQRPTPMARLVLGDVGSGKTVCAAAAVWLTAVNGMQSAVTAPTEILAAQHAATFEKLLSPFGITVGLLTSSVKGKARSTLLQKLQSGELQLLVGTHALISRDVEFKNLALVVADEQHRFGVRQRAALSGKGTLPHTLVMSATPIPRTMALMIYGDLDLSLIDEMPAGRLPVKTYLVSSELRERYLSFIRKAALAGRQAYIVCPLVEDPDGQSDLLAATDYFEDLREHQLRGISMGLIHGRIKPRDKAKIMQEFSSGRISVLVSTTVVEVGVDNPNAVIMLVENAERFGLSQLHQLRGRVGRGKEQSCCILVSDAKGDATRQRLEMMRRTNSGFELAQADLEMRGPGDFFGSRQHGLPELRAADLASDQRVLYFAGESAKQILEQDPDLKDPRHLMLRRQVEMMFKDSGGAPLN